MRWHVSSIHGDDRNDGKSPESALRTLWAAARLPFSNGDELLLECGSVFTHEALHLRSVDGLRISTYGEGPRPVVDAMGQGIWWQDYGCLLDNPNHVWQGYVSSSILLFDCNGLEVCGLEVRNSDAGIIGERYSDAGKMDRTGIAVIARDRGTVQDISLHDLVIDEVDGNVYDKHMANGGIIMCALLPEDEKATGPSRFRNILVDSCTLYNISRWGLSIGYTYAHAHFARARLADELYPQWGHEEIVVRNVFCSHIGGDAITVMYSLRPVVEHCQSESAAGEMNDRIYQHPGKRMGKVAAAIWPWKCKAALFTDNLAIDTRLNQDGQAWDCDSGDGTIYSHNASWTNEGGAVMFCMPEAVGSIFKDNVSHDDLGGIFSPADNPDALVTGNHILRRASVPNRRARMHGVMEEVDNTVEIIHAGQIPSWI